MACDITSLCSLCGRAPLRKRLKVSYAFQVVEIYSYLANTDFLSSHSLPEGIPKFFLYDVIVTDGNQKLLCHINHKLGCMVQTLQVFPYGWIKVDEIHIDTELKKNLPAYVVFDKIEPLTMNRTFKHSDIPYVHLSLKPRTGTTPLAVKREYFVDLWFSKVIDSRFWLTEPFMVQDGSACFIDDDPLITLAELASPDNPLRPPYSPMLLVVLLVSRVNHYGKSSTRDAYPFQLYLEVADHTGQCTLSVWGKAIRRIYPSVQVGSFLYVHNFRVGRNHFQSVKPRAELQNVDLPRLDIELKYNESGYGKLGILAETPQNESLIGHLPRPAYKLVQSKDLGTLNKDDIVDVAGVVLYVGRFERERVRSKYDIVPCEEFWVYHWIEVMDTTSSKPIRILAYVNSQIELHYQLFPSRILMYTQLQYVEAPGNNLGFYFRTTSYSQMYLGPDLIPFSLQNPHSGVVELGRMITSGWDTTFSSLENFHRVGGKYPLVVCETSLQDLKKYWEAKYETALPVTKLEHLPNEIKNLSYRECRQFYCEGFITRAGLVVERTEDIYDVAGNQWHYQKREAQLREIIMRCSDNIPTVERLNDCQCLDTFWPLRYTEEHKDTLLNWLSFPSGHLPPYVALPEDFPRLCQSVFQVDLRSKLEGEGKCLRCLFLPEPAVPHTSVMDLLSGNYQRKVVDMGGILLPPLHYSEEEIISILDVDAYYKVHFLFVINVYRCSERGFEITLHRAFPLQASDTE